MHCRLVEELSEMLKPFFVDKDDEPSERSLISALGDSYESFAELVQLSDSLLQEWKFYSPKYGWALKIFQKKKVLFYLTPGAGQFYFGMAVRENERDLILDSDVSAVTRSVLANEKKILEGYPLRIEVKNRDQLTDIKKAIRILDKERRLKLSGQENFRS